MSIGQAGDDARKAPLNGSVPGQKKKGAVGNEAWWALSQAMATRGKCMAGRGARQPRDRVTAGNAHSVRRN